MHNPRRKLKDKKTQNRNLLRDPK